MLRGKLLRYYKRKDIREAMVSCAKGKEVAIKFGDKGFGKRPEVLANPEDILEFVKQGATSFHCSEEIWLNPLALHTNMKKREQESLRKAWDLVLDIDGWFPLSKITTQLTIEALKFHDISSISLKFSGNKGFHIGIPSSSFPKNLHEKPISSLFPEGPRKIANYLKSMIEDHLRDRISQQFTLQELEEKTGIPKKDFMKNKQLDPFVLVDIDTLLISSRHLYRMPYSFHEKSGLISLPITIDQLSSFEREFADPEKIEAKHLFLTQKPSTPEASSLIVQAFDTQVSEVKEKFSEQREYDEITEALPESIFPPCIHHIFAGLKDGKKRAVFILINFLKSVGWSYEQIESRLNDWNKKNQEPLREVILKGSLTYHQRHNKRVLPPNCNNEQYYTGIGVCRPDSLCKTISNPVSYARKRSFLLQMNSKVSKKKKPKKDNEITEK